MRTIPILVLLALACAEPAPAAVHGFSFPVGEVTLPALLHVPDDGTADTVVVYAQGNPGGPLTPDLWLLDPLLERDVAVFRFTYRGLWGNGGEFFLANAIEDVDAALTFLTGSDAVAAAGVTPRRIVLFGYSFGAAVSLVGAGDDARVDGIASLAPCDHGLFGAEMRDPDSPLQPFFAEVTEALFGEGGPIEGGADAFVGDLLRNADAYRFPAKAVDLRGRKLLFLVGLDDAVCVPEDHFFPLYRALRSASHPALDAAVLTMDHGTAPVGRVEIARRLGEWVVASGATPMSDLLLSDERLDAFARSYTAAWNSGDPERVAGHYAVDGSLAINDGAPAVGREALAAVAAGFMVAFPDLALSFDGLEFVDGRVRYHWTFEGTHTGPGGSGNAVKFSGFESWTFDERGLVAESLGTFDAADYERQIAGGNGIGSSAVRPAPPRSVVGPASP